MIYTIGKYHPCVVRSVCGPGRQLAHPGGAAEPQLLRVPPKVAGRVVRSARRRALRQGRFIFKMHCMLLICNSMTVLTVFNKCIVYFCI